MNTLTQVNALTATGPSERVSSKYKFISSAQFIEDMRVNGWDLVNTVNRTRTGLGKHAMRFRNPALKLRTGDFLEIVVLNSHDGTTSFQLSLGIYRLVCSNGLVVGKDIIQPVYIRHVGYAAEKVKTALASLIEQSQRIQELVDKLQARILSVEEYSAFVNAALIIRGLKPHKVSAEQLHVPRRDEDKGLNAWAVLNRIQEYSVNGFEYTDLEEQRLKTARRLTGAQPQIKVNGALFDAITKIAA
jgi:hypothetical protein